MLNISTLCTSG